MYRTTLHGNTPSLIACAWNTQTKEELIKTAPAKFKVAEDGIKWMLTYQWVDDAKRIDACTLCTTLLSLVQTHSRAPKELIEGIQAAALCLEGMAMDSLREQVNGIVAEVIDSALGALMETINNVVSNVHKALEDTKEECTTAILQLQEEKVTEHNIPQIAQAKMFTDMVKASMATQALGPAHQEIFARSEVRERTVVVDCAEGADQGALKVLMEKVLLEKVKVAVEKIEEVEGWEGGQRPEEVKFMLVRRLPNGGVTYVAGSVEEAEWLRKPEVKHTFTASFWAEIIVWNPIQTLIIQFVPVTCGLTGLEIEEIEMQSNIPQGTFLEAKWMKAPASCKAN
jgi:hypothetical protein